MLLYHGSNVVVEKPQIIKSRKLLDFGVGFYLTSDYEQAKKWAYRTTQRREEGVPVISSYNVDMNFEDLCVLKFEQANREWLRYISMCRTDKTASDSYDIVMGPVANDQAIRTVNDYIKGRYTEDIAIQILLPQKLRDQYAFKTEKAVTLLDFIEVKYL